MLKLNICWICGVNTGNLENKSQCQSSLWLWWIQKDMVGMRGNDYESFSLIIAFLIKCKMATGGHFVTHTTFLTIKKIGRLLHIYRQKTVRSLYGGSLFQSLCGPKFRFCDMILTCFRLKVWHKAFITWAESSRKSIHFHKYLRKTVPPSK